MTPVTLTREIDTLRGKLPAGLCLFVLSWGDCGQANLSDRSGRQVVSMAPEESFEVGLEPRAEGLGPAEEFTTETRRHGEEHATEQGAEPLQQNGPVLGCVREALAVYNQAGPQAGAAMGSLRSHEQGICPNQVEANPGGPEADPRGTQSASYGRPDAKAWRSRTIGRMKQDHAVSPLLNLTAENAEERSGEDQTLRTSAASAVQESHDDCPFEPNVSGSRLPAPDSRLSDPNAELSALAQRDPAPLVNREESVRLARLVPRVIEVSPTLSAHVRERLAKFGYVLVDRDDSNYDPSKSQEEFTTEARRHGEATEERPWGPNDLNVKAGVSPAREPETMTIAARGNSVPPCLRGESFDWQQPLPAYEPNQIGWKLVGSRIVRVFQTKHEEC